MIPEIDKQIGINSYSTNFEGIGGQIRTSPEDFQVLEIISETGIIGILIFIHTCCLQAVTFACYLVLDLAKRFTFVMRVQIKSAHAYKVIVSFVIVGYLSWSNFSARTIRVDFHLFVDNVCI